MDKYTTRNICHNVKMEKLIKGSLDECKNGRRAMVLSGVCCAENEKNHVIQSKDTELGAKDSGDQIAMRPCRTVL